MGGEQQQQQKPQRIGGEVKETENMRLEIVSSIPVPDCVNESSPCVISLGHGANNHNHHQAFVMSGIGNARSSSSSSSLSCSECDCEGAFIMDRDCNNGSTKWNHIHTPAGFSGFPFAACHLTV